MKTFRLLPYLFALLLLGACSDDDSDQEPTPNPQNCRVTKITTTGEDAGVSTLTYDAQGRITGANLQGGEMEGTATIEYNGNLPTKATIRNGGIEAANITYTYDSQKRLTKLTTNISEFVKVEKIFEYNAKNEISKIVENSYLFFGEDDEPIGGFSQYTTFTYDAKGNITQEKVYEGETEASATLSHTIDYTYDNAVNPGKNMEMLLIGYSNPNNIVTAVQRANGTVDKDNSYSVTFKYNSSGLATEITSTTQNNEVSKSVIEYSCN